MLNINTYEQYFDNIARNYVPISHSDSKKQFASMNEREIMAGAKKDLNLNEWCLVLIDFRPRMEKLPSRQYYTKFECAFEVVKKQGKDQLGRTKLQDEAFGHCKQIIAKMMNDYFDKQFTLGTLVETDIEFYEIDAVFDTAVGYGATFSVMEGFSRLENFDSNLWV